MKGMLEIRNLGAAQYEERKVESMLPGPSQNKVSTLAYDRHRNRIDALKREENNILNSMAINMKNMDNEVEEVKKRRSRMNSQNQKYLNLQREQKQNKMRFDQEEKLKAVNNYDYIQPQETAQHLFTVNNFFKGRMSEQRQEQLAQIEAKKLRQTQEKFAI